MIYTHNIDPIAISIGGFSIYWYGIVYLLGFLFTERVGFLWQQKYSASPLGKDDWQSLVFGVFLCGVLGGRLGEFLFYSPSTFLTAPWEILKVWHGGMSIHGGILGAVIYLLLMQKKLGQSFLSMTDKLVTPLAFVLIFGRIANFINAELIGRPTDGSWGVIFPQYDNIPRYPSQLFESCKNLLLFSVLFLSGKRNPQTGTLTSIFLMGYGIMRFLIEFVREPDGMIGIFSTGQWLCLGMILIGGIILGIQKLKR